MKQEEKQILLQDLCARLPFGICANLPNHHLVSHKYVIQDIDMRNGWTTGILDCAGRIRIYSAQVEDIRQYLRTMSSMTEEEKSELLIHVLGNKENTKYFQVMPDGSIDQSDSSIQELSNFTLHWLNFDGINTSAYIDWLNAHHFDFRGMIEKGLAIEASKEMYKTE